MKLKIGDRVEYIGDNKELNGCEGTIIRLPSIASETLSRIIYVDFDKIGKCACQISYLKIVDDVTENHKEYVGIIKVN